MMNKPRKKYTIGISLSFVLAGIFAVFFLTPSVTHAQCIGDFPAARAWASFWTQTDFCNRTVEPSEIISGGPAPDMIPPIEDPVFESIDSAGEWLQSASPVIVLEIEGDARAYPLAILTWHEIVNDEVGGQPVAVTFCPLCNSSIVFDRRLGDEVLRLGVSGLLRKSDMVMWDNVTQSWWQQLTGEGIVGAYAGEMLTFVPSQVVGFGLFAEVFPDGVVLSRDTGHSRSYGRNPYTGYDSLTQPFLYDGQVDDRLPTMEHVLAGIIAQTPVAYPYSLLSELRVVNDEVNGAPLVAFWQDGAVSALDRSLIDESRDVGMASLYSRLLDDGTLLTFALDDDGLIRDEQTGSVWNMFGQAVEGELAGTQLFRELANPHFWFAWAAFKPDTLIFGATEE